MKTEEMENLLTNVLRFFILLLISTGIMIGMGIHFLFDYVGNGIVAEGALVSLICLGMVGASLWTKKSSNATATARMGTLTMLVVGVLVGMGASILIGITGSQMLVVLMFTVVLIWGLWVFRKKE